MKLFLTHATNIRSAEKIITSQKILKSFSQEGKPGIYMTIHSDYKGKINVWGTIIFVFEENLLKKKNGI